MIRQVDDLKCEVEKLDDVLRSNAINGRVLAHCDLMELKAVSFLPPSISSKHFISFFFLLFHQVMDLNFGHWEIFKLLITALRDIEKHQPLAKSVLDFQFDNQDQHPMPSRQKTTMEKQVKNC